MSHPVWVRGLKRGSAGYGRSVRRSHPVWVRGLKLPCRGSRQCWRLSHPVWVRGLKRQVGKITELQPRRTPCGCVD